DARADPVRRVGGVDVRLVEDEPRVGVTPLEERDGRAPDVGDRPPGLADPALVARGEPLGLAEREVLLEPSREPGPGLEREEQDPPPRARVLEVIPGRVTDSLDVLAPAEHGAREALEPVAGRGLTVGDEELVAAGHDPYVDRGEVGEARDELARAREDRGL